MVVCNNRKLLQQIKRLIIDNVRYGKSFLHKNSPIVFANSFPKSGTNLLKQILSGLIHTRKYSEYPSGPLLTYDNQSGNKQSIEKILSEISGLLPGEIAIGHLHAFPEVVNQLTRINNITFFLFRDPRDVVVSHAFYVTNMAKNHVHHRYYFDELPDMSARISTSITGKKDGIIDFPDIRSRFVPYFGWLENNEVLKIRFEDLVNDTNCAVQGILGFIEDRGFSFQSRREFVKQKMLSGIKPAQSKTYRKGATGDWKKYFTDDHKSLFKDCAGDLLLKLGYEESHDW